MPKDDIARIYTVSLVILAKFSGRQFSSQRQNADEAGSFAEKLEPCESVHQSYKWPLTAMQYGQYGQLPPLLHTAADLLGTPPMLGVRLLDFWTDMAVVQVGGPRHMEHLGDKLDQVNFVRSFQARSVPLPAAASWCLPWSGSFLGGQAADQTHRLAGTADQVFVCSTSSVPRSGTTGF